MPMKFKSSILRAAVCLSVFAATINVAAADNLPEKTPAFPGAEGYGKYTTGGRGGKVYHVTKLDDDTSTGTFRWANSQPGPRTIVFDVSGTIFLKSALRISENTTIAGQTAPGDGICFADYPVTVGANNIIRYVRFRLGNRQVAYHEGDGLGGMDSHDIIVDHCSISWSIDECLSVYGSENTTVQWCIVSHSLTNAGHAKGSHGYGGNWGGAHASYHHNLVANHTSRTPRLGPRDGTQTREHMDLRNNVIYNYGSNGCYGGEGMKVNIVNNYYKPGRTSNNRKSRITGLGIRTVDYCLNKDQTAKNINEAAGTTFTGANISGSRANNQNRISVGGKYYAINMDNNTIDYDGKTVTVAWNSWKAMLHTWGQLYVDGNYNPQDATVSKDNWTTGVYSQITPSSNDNYWSDEIKAGIRLDEPLELISTTTHSAQDAFDLVISYAGASHARDAYDEIVTSDARKGLASFTSTGIIDSQDQVKYSNGATGWPVLNSKEAELDTDGDGMPDEWEKAHGLNPNSAADGNLVNEEGYTMLEVYLAELVEDITLAQVEGGEVEGGIMTVDPVKDTYIISYATRVGTGTAWTGMFNDGISLTNTAGGSYSWYRSLYMRFARDHQHYIALPQGAEIYRVEIEGKGRYAASGNYDVVSLVELNGDTFSPGTYTLPDNKASEDGKIDATLAIPARNSLTMTFKDNNPDISVITLHARQAVSGIDDITVSEDEDYRSLDPAWYNLQGVNLGLEQPTAPGIYINRGRKVLVK